MTRQQVLDNALRLSEADRRKLAEALLDSVAPGENEIPVEWQEEFERRIADAKAHPEKGIPLDEFLEWLENRPIAQSRQGEREAG